VPKTQIHLVYETKQSYSFVQQKKQLFIEVPDSSSLYEELMDFTKENPLVNLEIFFLILQKAKGKKKKGGKKKVKRNNE